MPEDLVHPDRSAARPRLEERLADEARFIRTWLDNPVLTGAVSPSGRFLARMMARAVEAEGTGPIIELGPGTGPITQAMLARGVDPARLVLVEFDVAFCHLLRKRFPAVQVVQGDAYDLPRSLRGVLREPAAAVVSSLPLLNTPEAKRLALVEDAFALMAASGSFVQFTYGASSPVPRTADDRFEAEVSPPVWLNLPPARVWIYRRRGEGLEPSEDGEPATGVEAFEAAPRDAARLGLRAAETGLFRSARARADGLFRRRGQRGLRRD